MIFNSIFLIFVIWVLASIVYWSLKNGITPTQTTFKARAEILKYIPKMGEGAIVELGAGWGTMAFAMADQFPERRIDAFETSLFPYLYSRMRQSIFKRPNLYIHRCDFFSVSLNEASLIYCYLYPKAMEKLKVKFTAELRPNCVVISYTFAVPGWKPHLILKLDDLYHSKIYIYDLEILD